MKKFFCIALLYVCSAWQKLEAQEIGNSYINLEFREFDVRAEAILPVADLEFAYGKKIDVDLPSYISAHIHVKSEDGVAWHIEVEKPLLKKLGASGNVNVNMTFRPPSNYSTRRFMLFSSILNHKILNHRTYVIVKSDWDSGTSPNNPEGIGVIYSSSNDLNVFRDEQNIWKGIVGMFQAGLIHVRQGFDHIVFIVILILPMPFLYTRTRRDKFGELKNSGWHLFNLAAVFSVGHTAALLCGCVGWFRWPIGVMEILIAVIIIISAIHVFWPIVAGKEWILPLAFSVIHGLAYSSIISDSGLSAGRLVLSIIGFNLGVLVMQMLIMVFFAPWFFIAAESSLYRIVKYTVALVGIFLSLFWIYEIVSGKGSQVIVALNMLIGRPVWVVAFTAVIALLVRYYPGQSRDQHKD